MKDKSCGKEGIRVDCKASVVEAIVKLNAKWVEKGLYLLSMCKLVFWNIFGVMFLCIIKECHLEECYCNLFCEAF